MKTRELAIRIDKLAQDFDPFGYDCCVDPEHIIDWNTEILETDPDSIREYLNEIIDTDEDGRYAAEARQILAEIA